MGLDKINALHSDVKHKEALALRAGRGAVVALDQWDEPNFARLKAILAFEFPDTLAYLFRGGLEAKQGPEAVISVNLLCERVKALQEGVAPERATLRDLDQAAFTGSGTRPGGCFFKARERLF